MRRAQTPSPLLFGPIRRRLTARHDRADWWGHRELNPCPGGLRDRCAAVTPYPLIWYPLAELNRPLTAYRAAFLPLEEAGINWWAGEESNLASEERGFTDRLRNLTLYRPGATARARTVIAEIPTRCSPSELRRRDGGQPRVRSERLAAHMV